MLEIRLLSKVYPGGLTALKDVNLEIPEGMYGLVGPNGAGKTTLMRILAGLLEPTSGEVHLDGVDVLSDPSRIWCQLGYLPQDFGFYPHLSGDAMLRHVLELKGLSGAGGSGPLASQLLEAVNLTAAAKRRVKSYSGGMIQRLGIAQAIAGDPRLIIVDEPTAGLDPEERRRFYALLANRAEDRIVLLSTHIIEDVAVLCPNFAVIREGGIIARTTPVEARQAIEGKIYEAEVAGAGQEEEIRLAHTVLQAVLVSGRRRLRIHLPEGTPPPGFREVQPTLEDAYFVIMGVGGVPEASSQVGS